MELCPVVFFDDHLLRCLLKVNGVNKEEYIGSCHIIFEIPLKRARLCFLSGDTFLPAAAAPSSQTLNVVPARDFWVLRGNPDVPLSLLLFQNCVCGWGLRSSILLCFYEHLQVGRDIRVHWSFLAGLIEEISKCKTQIDCCWRRYSSHSTAASLFQYQLAPQRYDHWPDSPDSPLSGSGVGSAVLRLFYFQDVLVSVNMGWWSKAKIWDTSSSLQSLRLRKRMRSPVVR